MPARATASHEKSFFERIMSKLDEWSRVSEIDRMSAEDVRHLAHDIGLNANDLTRLAHAEPDAANLLYKRLEQLGVSMAEIEALGIGEHRDMERSCSLCGDRNQCAHDLTERPDDPSWQQICPNRATFEALERIKAERAR